MGVTRGRATTGNKTERLRALVNALNKKTHSIKKFRSLSSATADLVLGVLASRTPRKVNELQTGTQTRLKNTRKKKGTQKQTDWLVPISIDCSNPSPSGWFYYPWRYSDARNSGVGRKKMGQARLPGSAKNCAGNQNFREVAARGPERCR